MGRTVCSTGGFVEHQRRDWRPGHIHRHLKRGRLSEDNLTGAFTVCSSEWLSLFRRRHFYNTVLSKNVSDTLSRQTVTWKNETFCLWVCCHLVTERKHKVKESNCLLHLVSCEMELSSCSPWIHCGRRIHSHWEQMSKELWFFSSGWTAAQAGSLVETEEDTYHYHYKKILPLWFYTYQRCELESKSSDLTETWKVNLWFWLDLRHDDSNYLSVFIFWFSV